MGFENFIIIFKMFLLGLYYVRLFVEMNKEEGVINYDYGFFKVVLLDFVVKIWGVRKVVKGIGMIVLDVIDFYDFNEFILKD